jgi:hypothetical protein
MTKPLVKVYLISQFNLPIFNALFFLALILPAFAQPIHDIIGGSLYFYLAEIS